MAFILFSGKILQILTEETTPSTDLIATVKHLYETKLKVLFLVLTTFFLFGRVSQKNFCLVLMVNLFSPPGCSYSYSDVVFSFQR